MWYFGGLQIAETKKETEHDDLQRNINIIELIQYIFIKYI